MQKINFRGKRTFYFILFSCIGLFTNAQFSKFKTIDNTSFQNISLVTVSIDNKPIALSDSLGNVTLDLPAGNYKLSFTSMGFKEKTISVNIPFADVMKIFLEHEDKTMEDVTVIASTRSNQRIENSPLKVEVLGREEMNEENTIKPANIASILGDVSGIQIQQSSAISANAGVRIQGLESRYTQILKDGMPLFDGFSGGFGILSIPPLDLKQVELIKGSASTLYGGGAIGGLINIISKKPTTKQEAIMTLNYSTLNEANWNAFLSKRYKNFGYTFFSGYTHQNATDVNKDGFSDVPLLHTFIIHPRFFFYPDEKTTVTLGYTGTFEKRNGGDMLVLNSRPDNIHQFFENNKTGRNSGEFLIERTFLSTAKIEFKSSLSSFNRDIITDTHKFKGNQTDYFTELSAFIPGKSNSLVGGINISGNMFRKYFSAPTLLNNFSNNVVGIFIQNTYSIADNTTIEAGLRNDYTNKYGNFVLPRFAVFHRFNEHWGTRIGIGMGYKTPNPLATQLIDYNIENIEPLLAGIKAEKSVGYNAEVNYKKNWENGNDLFINQAFFLTKISSPVIATETSENNLLYANADKSIVTSGFDTYVKATIEEWEFYCGFTYTVAKRNYLQQNQFMPLTPRNRAAFTLVRDFEKNGWRFGLEGSYTGYQYRLDASKTPGYFFAAAMVEKKLNAHFSFVLNGENLLDYRQSKIEPLYTGTITQPVFQPLWAPIDGRVINLSFKAKL